MGGKVSTEMGGKVWCEIYSREAVDGRFSYFGRNQSLYDEK
jgi:hypothetical protein